MNYLAHFFLSHRTPDAITGAILGDFVKGQPPAHWSAPVRAAILLHRTIDAYTDRHVVTAASRSLVSPARRRFAGILVDIFYDHFLARYWERFDDRALRDFTRSVYRVLLPQCAAFPERLQRMLPWMAADDWLAAYSDIASVDAALNGMARRLRYAERAQPLATGVEELERNYVELQRHFFEFFPQLRAFVDASTGEASAHAVGST